MANNSHFMLPAQSSDSDISDDDDPTASPERELLWACASGDLAVVRRLLMQHKDIVNTADKDLYTPLHRAAYSNHNIILKVLLQHGASPHARTLDGWTPLHSACKWGSLECVRPLVRAGSDLNGTSHSGQTPLHLAATNRQAVRTLKYLLRQPGTSRTAVNSVGDTARDIAARAGPHAYLFDTVQCKSSPEDSREQKRADQSTELV